VLALTAGRDSPPRRPHHRPIPAAAAAPVPLARSTSLSAGWSGPRYRIADSQVGDIYPFTVARSGRLYMIIDDAYLHGQHPRKRNLFVQALGRPPGVTLIQIGPNEPLTRHYANGLISVDGVLYASRAQDWAWHERLEPFRGLYGIAYSTDEGRTWNLPDRPFGPVTGDLNFVQEGRDAANPDGFIYAISNEREYNADQIVLGRVRPGPSNVTDPSRWEWYCGRGPCWTSRLSDARPLLYWRRHFTYPHMTYDPALRRYLLTFTYSYRNDVPAIYRNGAQLVMMEGPHPWGPFRTVFTQRYFGPSNGYAPSIPIPWQGPLRAGHQDVWVIWGANFWGCAQGLDCSALYGMNMRRLRLYVHGRP
jgi:hypothetical protein